MDSENEKGTQHDPTTRKRTNGFLKCVHGGISLSVGHGSSPFACINPSTAHTFYTASPTIEHTHPLKGDERS